MTAEFYLGKRPAEEFEYEDEVSLSHDYLGPEVRSILDKLGVTSLLDLGCGNGTLTATFDSLGRDVVGLDGSSSGIVNATQLFPRIDFLRHDFDEELPTELRGAFQVVTAIEVIEHLYYPRNLFARAQEAISDCGYLVVTTPYHGTVKNTMLAVTGKFDDHWRPGWDHGHIKFFSPDTLAELARECGFVPVYWRFLGRIPILAKSMLMIAKLSDSRDSSSGS